MKITDRRGELRKRPEGDGTVVRTTPISPTGGLVVLKGNLAPDGALIKVAGLKSLSFEGRARGSRWRSLRMAASRARRAA